MDDSFTLTKRSAASCHTSPSKLGVNGPVLARLTKAVLIGAVILSAGWWFDACGPSNLNGMYFTQGQHIGKLNGIKWHYFKGPSYSLRATVMMIRPLDSS